jgi:hypothetical protein
VDPGTPPTQLFLLSLICAANPSDQELQVPQHQCSSAGGSSGCPHANVRHDTNTSHQLSGREVKVSWMDNRDPGLQQERQVMLSVARGAVPFVEAAQASRASGEAVSVRSLTFCGEAGTVAYGLLGAGSHYCARIGRAHRSNRVYLLLDFCTGAYCQKCFDPDCSGENCAHFRRYRRA